jgi:hypothetical protein
MALTESYQKTDLFKQLPKKSQERLNDLKAKLKSKVN